MATTPNATIDFEDMLPDEQYAVRVGAYDTMGNFSGFSDPTVITAATDNTHPARTRWTLRGRLQSGHLSSRGNPSVLRT